ncbi:hypothetical protein GCM10009801_36420 [Streptomyces albiaxialis]|uniref:S1 motif domain-containing protein n=1 Tax=Streptomyces albiaxialis TaxID=329523 RepID=A0ABP5HJF7_9ACTN
MTSSLWRLSPRTHDFASREATAAACVAAVAGFALDAGADELTLDNPMAEGFFSFSTRGAWRGNGLAGLFPADLSGYHDGARVPLATGLGLVRAMVLREGAWCRLRGGGGFFAHVGEHAEIHVGAARALDGAAARARTLGLRAQKATRSPYDPESDTLDVRPPADDAFWARVRRLVAERGAVLLEEQHAGHARRWHRLAADGEADAVRGRLAPRARLAVWPDLSEDIRAVRAAVRASERLALLVQRDADGHVRAPRVAEPWMGAELAHAQIPEGPGRRAGLVPLGDPARHALLTGLVPDADGVVRARWRADRTPADERRALLGSLRPGDVVTGTVVSGLDDVGVHVDLDRPRGEGLGFLRVPEMAWERFESVDEVAPVGREIRAEVLHVDWSAERVGLSVKALLPDPWDPFAAAHRPGDTVNGTVVARIPPGTLVRLAPGIEGLLPDADGTDGADRTPGAAVRVTLAELDRERRRILLTEAD